MRWETISGSGVSGGEAVGGEDGAVVSGVGGGKFGEEIHFVAVHLRKRHTGIKRTSIENRLRG